MADLIPKCIFLRFLNNQMMMMFIQELKFERLKQEIELFEILFIILID